MNVQDIRQSIAFSMNNIEDLVQRGYFQQYNKEGELAKRQTAGGSRRREEVVRNEGETAPKKKNDTIVIFRKSGGGWILKFT